MKNLNRLLSILIALLIILSCISSVFAKPTDYSGHWAGREIAKWLSFGIIQTDAKGDFKPNEPIKRIDIAVLLNKLFNYQDKSNIKFSDIPNNSPYAADAAKAAASGNFSGDNGRFRPNDKITRQEAAVVFARAFDLSKSDNKTLTKFMDAGKIASWSKDSVGAMVGKGFMSGKSGGLFAPASFLTRAEAVKIVDNMVNNLKNKAGTYTGNINGNLVVSTQNVILENMTIKGDLYLTEGIGSGEVTLNNVKVSGRTIIKGGGENSIVLNNTTVGGSMIVIKKNGKVRVVASGSSEVVNTVLSSGAKLEENDLTGGGFGNVEVMRIEPGQQVTLDGDFNSLSIETDGVVANIPDGKVGTVKVKEGTNGSKLNVGNSASVGELIADDDITVTGGSRIEKADINSNGVVLDSKPGVIDIADNVTASVEGSDLTSTKQAAPAAPPAAPSAPPPSGGNGGGDGGGNPGGGDDNDDTVTTPTITLTAGNKTIIVGSTTSSAITVNPADAVLGYSSGKPSVASVNSTTGVITGVSTGSAIITVTASKSGYNSATATFTVVVVEDTFPPTVTAAIDKKNNITLTFSEPVLRDYGSMHVQNAYGFRLGDYIDLNNENEGVEWESATSVRIFNTTGNTGLDDFDAQVIKIIIEYIRDTTPRKNLMANTTITLQANDTKAPRMLQFYSAKAGSTADGDTISFYFSEAMDTNTLADLGNYKVTTPGGAYYTGKTLKDYKDSVSVASIDADKKRITFIIPNAKAAAIEGLKFFISGLTDIAGNLIEPAEVAPYISDGFYITSITATAKDKIEIEFSQPVGICNPGAFILRKGVSSTSPACAYFISITINEKKVTAIVDRNLPTDLNGIYFHIFDYSLTRSVYGDAVTTASGILAGGPIAVPDKVKPEVEAFTATYGGIIVEFSEPVTTTAEGFLNELMITRDGYPVMIGAGSISAVDGDLSTGFTKLLISGLESGTEYHIQLYPRGVTTDKSSYHNSFKSTDMVHIIIK